MMRYILLLGLGYASFASAESWQVPGFNVKELNSNGDDLVEFIAKEGIAVLSGIEGLKEAREEALQAALSCAYSQPNNEESLTITFPNGVKRITWATSSVADPFKMTCNGDPKFSEKANTLRNIVEEAAENFIQFLDERVLRTSSKPLLKSSNPEVSYQNFKSIVNAGEHLDHLHVYMNKMADSSTVEMNVDETLELHTDNGLFVAFVPSMRLDFSHNGNVEDGFSIERSDGAEVNLEFPDGGNVLVFMFGDGINWMNKEVHTPIRIVPHALRFSKYTFARAWFGRMFLPPKDAIVREEGNFEVFQAKARDLLSVVTGEVMGLGCSGSRFRILDAAPTACAGDEMYCWMACRSIASLNCTDGTQLKCINSVTGVEWVDNSDSHCPKCLPTCFNVSQSTSPTLFPTKNPTKVPTSSPINKPTIAPVPTNIPTKAPTNNPLNKPTASPSTNSTKSSGAYMITIYWVMTIFTIINFFIMLFA